VHVEYFLFFLPVGVTQQRMRIQVVRMLVIVFYIEAAAASAAASGKKGGMLCKKTCEYVVGLCVSFPTKHQRTADEEEDQDRKSAFCISVDLSSLTRSIQN
jgi:hypothetical protein